ncbi:hypothetical protein [Flavobacterium sp.]
MGFISEKQLKQPIRITRNMILGCIQASSHHKSSYITYSKS